MKIETISALLLLFLILFCAQHLTSAQKSGSADTGTIRCSVSRVPLDCTCGLATDRSACVVWTMRQKRNGKV